MHAATDNVATAVIVVVVIVRVGIVSVIVAVGSEAEPYKRTSVKFSSVKSSTVEASSTETGASAAMETTTAAVEAPTTKSTAMADTATHAASVPTAAATPVATTATATSECRSWLNQANRCQCEQGYNRFSHMPSLTWTKVAFLRIQHFRSRIIRRSDSVGSKLTVSLRRTDHWRRRKSAATGRLTISNKKTRRPEPAPSPLIVRDDAQQPSLEAFGTRLTAWTTAKVAGSGSAQVALPLISVASE